MGGRGGAGKGKATQFETENSAFVKLRFKTQKINAITQVSQGILSTIVGSSSLLKTMFVSRRFIRYTF